MYQIAVIDDSELWCLAFKTMLNQGDFRVTAFTSTRVFLESVERFDLALVDYSIPARSFQQQIDGCEIIAYVREHSRNPPVLVLMSAYFTNDILLMVHEFCPVADAFLSKDSMHLFIKDTYSEQTTPLVSQHTDSVHPEALIEAIAALLNKNKKHTLQSNQQ